jgi:hypothetical protein
MVPSALPTTCPDCGGALRAITLFGRGPQNPISGAATDTAVIYYTDAEANRSPWLSMLDIQGEVRTLMCRGCNRLFFYGVPKEKP